MYADLPSLIEKMSEMAPMAIAPDLETIANDDMYTVISGESETFDILANDQIENLESITITMEPLNGTVSVDG